jgi:hypothetical protein
VPECIKVSTRNAERISKEQKDSALAKTGISLQKPPSKKHRKCDSTNFEPYEMNDFKNLVYNFRFTEERIFSMLQGLKVKDFFFQEFRPNDGPHKPLIYLLLIY